MWGTVGWVWGVPNSPPLRSTLWALCFHPRWSLPWGTVASYSKPQSEMVVSRGAISVQVHIIFTSCKHRDGRLSWRDICLSTHYFHHGDWVMSNSYTYTLRSGNSMLLLMSKQNAVHIRSRITKGIKMECFLKNIPQILQIVISSNVLKCIFVLFFATQ